MRIAIVSPYGVDVPGGVQQQVLELAQWLRDSGHEAFVVAPAGDSVGGIDVGRTIGIRANGSVAPIALSPSVFRRVAAALSEADVVHIHEPIMPMVGWAALRSNIPAALTFHADPSGFGRWFYRVARPFLFKLRSAPASAVSATAESAVGGVVSSPTRIPNALNVGSYRVDLGRVTGQVVFLGRPDRRKGRDLLLDAWPAVRSRVPDATLIVMGGGNAPSMEGVTFAGQVDEEEKRRILASSQVFCAPNRGGESFGIAVAEGMAAGCAVVASDIPAFIDLLDGVGAHHVNGDAGDLAEVLGSVLMDPRRLSAMARMSAERISAFDWDVVGEKYLELYERALAR